jgi:peptide/nickel transport system substrate-binding protein
MRESIWPLLLMMILGVTGCAPSPPPAHESILIYGRGQDAVSLDPADAEDGESVKILTNVFDTLVHYDENGTEIVPALAEKWETSADGKTWTFQLREGVRFHDGTPFDGAAVAFTFDRLIHPDNPHRYGAANPYRADYATIEKVDVTSPQEVVFRLKEPSGVFLRKLAMFPASIVSPTSIQKLGDRFRTEPVGTGAFVFVEWLSKERLTLAANKDYWRGKPAIEEVIFKPILEPAARRRQLLSGEIHMADELSIPVRKQIEKDPTLVLETCPGMNTAYLAMNNDHPPFNDVRVRQAIAHAIDKSAIARSAYEDAGMIASTLVPKAMWGHHPALKDYAYDPNRSRELLKEAGVAPGTKVVFYAMRNSRPYLPSPEQVTAIITQELKEIGFEPIVKSPDWASYLDQVGNGEHDICLMGWQTDNADPDNFLFALLDKENAIPPKAHNLSFYRSEEVHQLLVEAQRKTEQDQRLSLYERAQTIIHDDCPMVPLMHLDLAIARTKNVAGYKLHPTGLVMLRSARLEPSGSK